MNRRDLGQMTGERDRRAVRLQRTLDVESADVWKALTEPAQLRIWLAPTEIDPRPGGSITIDFSAQPDGGVTHGTIRVWEPPSVLEYDWTEAGRQRSVVRFELRPAGNRTMLTLTHRLLADGEVAGVAAGWQSHADALEDQLRGIRPSRARIEQLRAQYQELRSVYAATLSELDQAVASLAEAAEGSQPVRAILFTDIEGSSSLRQRLGDEQGQALVRTHNELVRAALVTNGGNETKHTGDGIMASFPSASASLSAAVSIQRSVAQHASQHPEPPLRVRIGLNAGEPIAEEQDLFGTSVDLAKRICDRAEPEQILVSDVVRQLAAGKGFLFWDMGHVELRGFEDPVRIYEVNWRDVS